MEGALLAVVGVVVGVCGTLATGFLQDRWRRDWERETDALRRAAVRAEEAANTLLPLLDQITALLPAHASWNTDIDDEALEELSNELNRLAVHLGSSGSRARVEGIAMVITRTHTIAGILGDRPGTIGWQCHRAGRNVAAHALSGEVLESNSVVDQYCAAIEESYALDAEPEEGRHRAASQADDPPDT